MTEQEVLQQLVDTNNQLVAIITGDENTEVDVNGTLVPSHRKFIKDTLLINLTALKNETQALRDEVVTLKASVDDSLTTINNIKDEIDTIKADIDSINDEINKSLVKARNIQSDAQAAMNTVLSLKDTMNNYVGKMDKDYNAFLVKYDDVKNMQTEFLSLTDKVQKIEWAVRADRKTVEDYAHRAVNNAVRCWSSNGDGTFSYTETCDFSTYHYWTKVVELSSQLQSSCKEFIALSLRDGEASTLCVLGTPGDEYLEVELRDGTEEQIGIKGN